MTVQNVDTDILNAAAFSPPVVVSGVYFIGAGAAGFGAFAFAAPQDILVASLGRAWATGDTGGVANYANLAANNVPPVEMDTTGFLGVWRLRADCEALPEVQDFCFPGALLVLGCPCGILRRAAVPLRQLWRGAAASCAHRGGPSLAQLNGLVFGRPARTTRRPRSSSGNAGISAGRPAPASAAWADR